MQLITTRDFRANQKKYFELAEKEPIFVMRRGARPVSITVVNDADILSEKELRSIKKGLEDIKAGRIHTMSPDESLSDFLERI
ncbi:MAG: prevent-host-death protein [Muribaculaceae bacterium]|nr:prevent-host-death protein [Muribaculaceae bacterium]